MESFAFGCIIWQIYNLLDPRSQDNKRATNLIKDLFQILTSVTFKNRSRSSLNSQRKVPMDCFYGAKLQTMYQWGKYNYYQSVGIGHQAGNRLLLHFSKQLSVNNQLLNTEIYRTSASNVLKSIGPPYYRSEINAAYICSKFLTQLFIRVEIG